MAVKVEVWGEYACFSNPALKVERVSYDVMTPSAARGILEAIFWHPGLVWRVDRIHVLAPIKFTSVRRNEVKSKVVASSIRTVMGGGNKPLFISTSDDIQQRASLVLQDVHYVIEAHFDMTGNAAPTDNPGKFADIMRRRLEKGQCYHRPCFGMREFPAHFRKWEGETIPIPPENMGSRDMGLMLYDLDYSNPEEITPMFFRAKLVDGVLDVRDCEVLR